MILNSPMHMKYSNRAVYENPKSFNTLIFKLFSLNTHKKLLKCRPSIPLHIITKLFCIFFSQNLKFRGSLSTLSELWRCIWVNGGMKFLHIYSPSLKEHSRVWWSEARTSLFLSREYFQIFNFTLWFWVLFLYKLKILSNFPLKTEFLSNFPSFWVFFEPNFISIYSLKTKFLSIFKDFTVDYLNFPSVPLISLHKTANSPFI